MATGTPPPPLTSCHLGQRIRDAGLITDDQLELALRERARLGISLGEALVQLAFVSQETLASFLAEDTRTRVVDVTACEVPPDALRLIPYEFAQRHHVLPIERIENRLTVALADTYNVMVVDAIERMTGLQVDVVTAPKQAILESIERQYAQDERIVDTIQQLLQQGIGRLGEEGSGEGPMVRLCNQLIVSAIQKRATDIHIEPDESTLRVRLRIDGVLHQEVVIPQVLQPAVLARFKLMANLNVTEKRIPQDGRIPFSIGMRHVDLRVSTLPTNHGESIVLRVLDQSSVKLEFSALGFRERDQKAFLRAIHRPYGLILITGPTGSGKTTTLYTALTQINAKERSVFTLEDPIEYQLPFVRQTPIRPDVGMTFAAGLRALLRQDPDVILVGEIRDKETADLALRAALTGHLVFSTLHTNDAIGAIPRLIDMGVEPFLLASALVAVVGQRLVRRICASCQTEREHPERILAAIDYQAPPDSPPLRLWHGTGCRACSNTGYRGRLGIYELLLLDDRFHYSIVHGPDLGAIAQLARAGGMESMADDGIAKALQGQTTIEEVMRVVRG